MNFCQRLQFHQQPPCCVFRGQAAAAHGLPYLGQKDQGDKLDEEPPLHLRGPMDPKALHIQGILEIIKALFNHIFFTVDPQALQRILVLAGQDHCEAYILFAGRKDGLAVSCDAPATFRSSLDRKETRIGLFMFRNQLLL